MLVKELPPFRCQVKALVACKKGEGIMTINILTPRGESAPRQVGRRPAAKAYVPPSLKVYGGVSQLTANGTSGAFEDNGSQPAGCNAGTDFTKGCHS